MIDILKTYMTVEMDDGSTWAVPVSVIAENRAAYYAKEYDGDVAMSLNEDTIPLFQEDLSEIEDWASGNMNWDEVAEKAFRVATPKSNPDYQEGWVNGNKGFMRDGGACGLVPLMDIDKDDE